MLVVSVIYLVTFFAAVQSLGETQIDLGAPALVPPPTSLVIERSRDPRSRSPLVGQEGDINDAVIDNIVDEDSTIGDDYEGNELIMLLGIAWSRYSFLCPGQVLIYNI